MLNFIKEWKNVSDDTVAIASDVVDKILSHSKGIKKKLCDFDGITRKDGCFDVNVDGLLKDLKTLQVKYTIYYCESTSHYYYLLKGGKLNDTADYFDGYIQIKVAYIDNVLKDDFIDDVHHEINHLLETSKGFTKSEKSENLYNLSISIAQDTTRSTEERAPAYLIYNTFHHEEDSYVVQYYSYLKRVYKDLDVLNAPGMFDKTLNEFEPYKNIKNLMLIYNDHSNEPCVLKCIKEMGFTVNTFEKRVEHGIKRLRDKSLNAYQRRLFEMKREKLDAPHLIEWYLKRDMLTLGMDRYISRDYFLEGID